MNDPFITSFHVPALKENLSALGREEEAFDLCRLHPDLAASAASSSSLDLDLRIAFRNLAHELK